jgi:outer membrane PBP1 activator LpoA protein
MGKDDIEGSGLMIADELRVLFDEIKAELVLLRADITLINHDIMKAREQLDRIERNAYVQTQEPIGLAPGTPPPDFLPPELM